MRSIFLSSIYGKSIKYLKIIHTESAKQLKEYLHDITYTFKNTNVENLSLEKIGVLDNAQKKYFIVPSKQLKEINKKSIDLAIIA